MNKVAVVQLLGQFIKCSSCCSVARRRVEVVGMVPLQWALYSCDFCFAAHLKLWLACRMSVMLIVQLRFSK